MCSALLKLQNTAHELLEILVAKCVSVQAEREQVDGWRQSVSVLLELCTHRIFNMLCEQPAIWSSLWGSAVKVRGVFSCLGCGVTAQRFLWWARQVLDMAMGRRVHVLAEALLLLLMMRGVCNMWSRRTASLYTPLTRMVGYSAAKPFGIRWCLRYTAQGAHGMWHDMAGMEIS